jgi:HK97 family phage major capsid protein
MTKLKVPTDSAGLQEVLTDPAKLKEYFSQASVANGDTTAFLDAYAKQYVKTNTDTVEDMRTQVQSVLFDMIRDAGGGAKPMLDLGKAISFRGGRPELNLSANGTPAVSRGRGAVYNKIAPGAVFEAKHEQSERFGSIGEYLQAIREEARPTSAGNRRELLQKLETVRSFQASFGSEDPAAGGFLIPEIMRSELLQLALEESIVRSRATVIPMSTLRVPIPTVDDTSHVSSLFGGITFAWTEESAALAESQAKFGRVVLDAKKLTGFFKVPNELLADAPAFSSWFDTRIPAGLAWTEDVAFMTETGAGTPQGFINSPAYILTGGSTGSPSHRQVVNAISYADIVAMYARMLPTSLKNAVWIASIDSFPQLAQMTLATPGVWMGGYNVPGVSDAPPISIFGRPVYFTEKVPATSTSGGASGDISFVDLSYYLIGDRQSVAVAASDQFAFQNDQTAYRLIERVDGRPWVQSALTPHNGGPTLSPFVGLTAAASGGN